jgi:hypothetical protein
MYYIKHVSMERVELISWLGKTKTAARRTVSEHLKTLPIDTRFTDKWIQALVQYHPSKSYPAVNIVFAICSRPPFFTRSLFVEARTGGLVDCSWVKCIANLFGSYDTEKQTKTKVLAALRNEAFMSDAMQEARASLGGECSKGTFKLSTRAMSKAWRAFHDNEATLKGLCAKCNCSLGSGGYRHVV